MKINDIYSTLAKGYAIYKREMQDRSDKVNQSMFKVLNLKNIRELNEGEDISYSLTPLVQKYQKDILYVQKNDIIFPVAVGTGRFNILYIENEPHEKYIYSNSCFVLRINEKIINSKYVFIQLLTNDIQEQLLQVAKGDIIRHISKNDILNLNIPELGKSKMKRICDDYDELKKKRKQLEEEEQKFWNSLKK